MLHFFHNFKISCKGNKKHSNNQIKIERYDAHFNLMFIIHTCDVFNRLNAILPHTSLPFPSRIPAVPLTHPCHSPHASLLFPSRPLQFPSRPCNSTHALKEQKLLAQGTHPGYSCPHAWRPERAKALYDLRPALSPVSVSLSPVFGVIAGKVCNFSFMFVFLPLPFLRSCQRVYSYTFPIPGRYTSRG